MANSEESQFPVSNREDTSISVNEILLTAITPNLVVRLFTIQKHCTELVYLVVLLM